jgi:DNA polymerase/3'-5' exonuclease PolX
MLGFGQIYDKEGMDGVEKIPGVGDTIARSIRDILLHGKLAMFRRTRSSSTAPICAGIGEVTAWKLYEDLGIESLEELEASAHDGRLEQFPGIGAKRIAGIRDTLAQRLGRMNSTRRRIGWFFTTKARQGSVSALSSSRNLDSSWVNALSADASRNAENTVASFE